MAERRAAGFNIPLNFYDGAEVNSIPKRIRAAAIGVWALAGDYAATQLTDGYVPADVLETLGCTNKIRAALKITVNKKGELSPLWIDGRDGGIQLTNWTKHQRTNDEVTTYRSREAERKRAEREAKRNATTSKNGKASGRTSGGQNPGVRPDARDPKTKTESVTYLGTDVALSGGSGGRGARGTRLPDDWTPPADVVAQMRADHPHVDLKAEHAKFVDYWIAKPGKDAEKRDWPATWRNWIRRAAEKSASRNGHHPSPTMSAKERRFAEMEALRAKYAAEELKEITE